MARGTWFASHQNIDVQKKICGFEQHEPVKTRDLALSGPKHYLTV
jgi:hypothetical protein